MVNSNARFERDRQKKLAVWKKRRLPLKLGRHPHHKRSARVTVSDGGAALQRFLDFLRPWQPLTDGPTHHERSDTVQLAEDNNHESTCDRLTSLSDLDNCVNPQNREQKNTGFLFCSSP